MDIRRIYSLKGSLCCGCCFTRYCSPCTTKKNKTCDTLKFLNKLGKLLTEKCSTHNLQSALSYREALFEFKQTNAEVRSTAAEGDNYIQEVEVGVGAA